MLEPARQILILGVASGFAGEAIDLAEECGLSIAALVTNIPLPPETGSRWRYPLHELASLPLELRDLPAIAILGTPKYRALVVQQASAAGISRFVSLVHPTAYISRSVSLGSGCLVNIRATIASNSAIGAHVVVNRGASIGHDNDVEDFCTIAPGATTGGFVRVLSGAYLGMGSIVLPGVVVGRNAVVAAGAVVTEDVPDSTMVAGVPAAIKKENIAGYRGS